MEQEDGTWQAVYTMFLWRGSICRSSSMVTVEEPSETRGDGEGILGITMDGALTGGSGGRERYTRRGTPGKHAQLPFHWVHRLRMDAFSRSQVFPDLSRWIVVICGGRGGVAYSVHYGLPR